MTISQRSPEVFLADGPIASIGPDDIATLRSAVAKTPRRRARINAHPDGDDLLHEMIIALDRASYIRPHIHPGKSEAFHIIEGAVDIVIFDHVGAIDHVVPLAAPGGPAPFYYRMSKPFYHSLVIHSDLLVVHEITNGPFRREGTLFAPFAPVEDDDVAARAYQDDLRRRAAAHREARA